MRDKVDFFVVGTQKGGTTALTSYIARHPGLQLALVKEVHHFDDEVNVHWSNPDHGRLHRHFNWDDPAVLRGEATPIYMYWPPALPRLKAYNPEARLIVMLRHPAHRAHSHWRMETARGLETLDFEKAVGDEARGRVRSAPFGSHRVYSYIERGFYSDQIERLLALFPRSQVHFVRTDRLWQDPINVLAGIEEFLGVENRLASVRRDYIVPIETSGIGSMSQAAFERLTSQFAHDIARTAALTGLHLTDWLDPSYVEPMPRHA